MPLRRSSVNPIATESAMKKPNSTALPGTVTWNAEMFAIGRSMPGGVFTTTSGGSFGLGAGSPRTARTTRLVSAPCSGPRTWSDRPSSSASSTGFDPGAKFGGTMMPAIVASCTTWARTASGLAAGTGVNEPEARRLSTSRSPRASPGACHTAISRGLPSSGPNLKNIPKTRMNATGITNSIASARRSRSRSSRSFWIAAPNITRPSGLCR